jgi:Sec-independent protein translocase protein TatA
MIGTIVKLAILAIVILIGLKIFSPETADKAVNQISESTGISKDTINQKLDDATAKTIDGAKQAADAAKAKLNEVQEDLSK